MDLVEARGTPWTNGGLEQQELPPFRRCPARGVFIRHSWVNKERYDPSRCGVAIFLVPHRTWAPEQLAGDLPAGGGDTPGVVSENQETKTDPDRSRDGQ